MNKRRLFLKSALAIGVTASIRNLLAQATEQDPLPPIPKRPPPLEPSLVKEFVIAGHKDLELTKQLHAANPTLINATWDWGGGDYETALGGASHMGNRAIALYLLENGARIDLFAAAMLGQTDIVRAAIESDHQNLNTRGPHGIPLIKHAEKGGEYAAETLAYLKSIL